MPEDFTKIKKESSHANAVCCDDGDFYPWGTRIELEDELIDDLGVESLAPGDLVEVRGFAIVQSKSERADKDETNRSMSLQLTSLKLKREESDHVKQLYGE